MKKVSIFIISLMIFSVFLLGCSKSPQKVLENAVEKSQDIGYSNVDVNMNVAVAGVGFDIMAKGEVNNKEKKAALDVEVKSPMFEGKDVKTNIYLDKETMYIKDPETGMYKKILIPKEEAGATDKMNKLSKTLYTDLINDKSVKDSIKMEDKEESNKVVSFNISNEAIKSIIIKALDNKEIKESMLKAFETEYIAMAKQESNGKVDEKVLSNKAKEESNKFIEEYKKTIEKVNIENTKYSSTINGDGYISATNMSMDIKDAETGLIINIKLNVKQSDINANKKVNIPSISADKVVHIK